MAPVSAEVVTVTVAVVARTMQETAPNEAPAVTPMMSGLASGLRTSRWKSWPDRPKAAPTSTPVSARGQPQGG